MVRHLKNVTAEVGAAYELILHCGAYITCEEEAEAAVLEHQHQRGIVGGGRTGSGVQNGKRQIALGKNC